MGNDLCSGEKKRKYSGPAIAQCQSGVNIYPFLMPNLVLGLTETVEVRYAVCHPVHQRLSGFYDTSLQAVITFLEWWPLYIYCS